MLRIEQLANGSLVQGRIYATVMAFDVRHTRGPRPRCDVMLEDCTGRLEAVFHGSFDTLAALPIAAEVRAQVRSRTLDGRRIHELVGITLLRAEERTWNATQLMAFSACPLQAREALSRLDGLFHSLKSSALRRFLGGVLVDPKLKIPFVTCQASRSHHHALPGGLLVHSVETALRARAWSDSLSPELAELVQVAALLHDIGKIRTVGGGKRRPELGRWVRHDDLTLEMIAPHIGLLDASWPEGAALLRHSLTWYRPMQPSGYARFIGADILRACDGIDTAIDLGKNAPLMGAVDRWADRHAG